MRAVFINLWRSKEGLVSAAACLSEEDALDDISSPAEGWAYVVTIIQGDGPLREEHLAEDAAVYAASATGEWLYWLNQAEAHGDKVA